jgi:UDP-N-acetyl-2-amino-2-deoxyglucuronate dehydrogenase
MPQEFHFAILGCGAIAQTQAEAISALEPEAVKLAACVDSAAERAEALAAKFSSAASRSWQEVLADPRIDAVTICTPSGLHGVHTEEALAAGKHVIVEKPMDVSLEACDRMLEAAKRAGKILAVISQHRFDPASAFVKAAIDQGRLGKLVAVEVRVPWYRTQEYYDSGNWRGTWKLDGGGCLMNQGIHTVDLMRWLCGPLRSVTARMTTATHERIEVEDLIVGTLEFENGALGTLIASTSLYPGLTASIAVYGEKGTAVIDGDCLRTFSIVDGESLEPQEASHHAIQVATGGTRAAVAHSVPLRKTSETAWGWGEAHRVQLLDFVRACRGEQERPLIDGMEGRNAVEAVLALYKAALEKRPVELPLR